MKLKASVSTQALQSLQPRRPVKVATSRAGQFPIVGIGASAGGLEAFIQLLEELPADTGMALVFVQHLYPGHESALPQILSRATSMAVHEAIQGVLVRPNQVYVIPPGSTMTLEHGRLHLAARDPTRAPHLSIDGFFQSLSLERQQCAIGVVFSGNAADGTQGLEAIKAGGGITFAQDKSAQYDSMPRSAIAAGCVDHVLPPAGVARELARIAGHPYFHCGPRAVTDVAPPPPRRGAKSADQGLTEILDLIQKRTGVDFAAYKPSTLLRRITRRMLLCHRDSVAAYARHVAAHPAELKALCGDLLIGVTSFFRDPAAYEALKRHVYAKLIAERSDVIRIWTIGCASGQETYSLAMLFLEIAERFPHRAPRLQIFGTDLNEALLDRARRGLYPKSLMQGVSPARLNRFFVEEPGGYRVTKTLRDQCIFGRQDLLGGPPFSRMDLITCRNVLIYIDPAAQKRILTTLHYALRPGGWLMLGVSESVGALTGLFEAVDRKQKIYQRKSTSTPALSPPLRLRVEATPALRHTPRAAPLPSALQPERQAQHKADRVMMNQFAPPGVVVDGGWNVIEFRGVTDPYLTPPSGKASFHLLKLAREGLVVPLRSALNLARRRNQPVRRDQVRVDHRSRQTVNLHVIPLTQLRGHFFLIVFNPPGLLSAEVTAAPAGPPLPPGRAGDRQLLRRNAGLERELRELRDYLQSLQQQHDASQEELQGAIEEAQSANEELQTVNEELETSKEELESGNEELIAVNEEMAFRVGELSRLNHELQELHASLRTPIVMLDRDLAIRRFTPAAEKAFNLIAADIGRPLGGIKHNLQLDDLGRFLRGIITRRIVREREVQDLEGRWCLLRAGPHVSAGGKLTGVIVVLFDIDAFKRRAAVSVR